MNPAVRCGVIGLMSSLIGCGVSHDQHEQVQKCLGLTEQKLALAQQVIVLHTNVLAIPPAVTQRGYTLLNETNRMTVLWHGSPVWQTTNTDYDVSVSPDGRSAVWSMECFPYNNERPAADERTERYSLLWSAHDDNKPVLLTPPRQSRGVDTDQLAMFLPPSRHAKTKLTFADPENFWFSCGDFHWDSTGAYLYFSTGFGTVSGWWQLKPGTRDVRFVDYGGQFWLLPQPNGADQVLIQGLRYEGPPAGVKNYSNCYLYTPEDIAKPIFTESHVRKKPSPTWGDE